MPFLLPSMLGTVAIPAQDFTVSIIDTEANIFARTGDDIGTIAFSSDSKKILVLSPDGWSEWLSGGFVVSIIDLEASILARTGDDMGTIAFSSDSKKLFIVSSDGWSEWSSGGFVVEIIDTSSNILARTGDDIGTIAFSSDTKLIHVLGSDGWSIWGAVDSDGDGVPDDQDPFPNDPTKSSAQNQTISFTLPATVSIEDGLLTLVSSASSGLDVTYSISNGASFANINGQDLEFLGAGTVTVTADQAGNAQYNAAPQVSQTITIEKISQTIDFTLPSTANPGHGNITLGATSSSGLAVTYSISQGSGIASIAGNQLVLSGVGDVTVLADQAGDSSYNAAPQVYQTITLQKDSQTIDFSISPSFNRSAGNLNLGATASSGLQVSYSITQGSDIASLVNGELVFSGGGDVTVSADQPGDASYNAAPQVVQSVTITDDVTDSDGDGEPDITDAFPNDDRYTEHSFAVSIIDTSSNILARTGDDIGTIAFGTDTLSLYVIDQHGNFQEWLSGGFVVSIIDTSSNILARTGDDIGTIAFGTDTEKLYVVGNDGFSEWGGAGDNLVIDVFDTEANILMRAGDQVGTVAFGTDTNALYIYNSAGFDKWSEFEVD